MQLEFRFLASEIPEPPVFQKGEGWYGIVFFYYPTKQHLKEGKRESEETLIYAKTLLSAKQTASKWANSIRAKSPISAKYPIENSWEEVSSTGDKYEKYWKKKGRYFSCNPEIYLVPNSIVE